MNHRRSKHSQIMWTEINRVGPTPVDLESTDYFTLSFIIIIIIIIIHELSPSQYKNHVRNPNIYLSHLRCWQQLHHHNPLPEIVTGDWTERNINGRVKYIDWKSGRRLSEKQAWTR